VPDEDAKPRPIGPFRLTTPREGRWLASIPWPLEAPLIGVFAYLVATGPLAADHLIPAGGVALAIVILALPGLVHFAPGNRSWTHRTASIWPEGITVDRPGTESRHVTWAEITRMSTRPISLGMQFPQTLHLVTDFYGADGERIPELTVHHSSYRQIVGRTDINDDGPSLLSALQKTPCADAADLASRTLVDLVAGAGIGMFDGLSPETVTEIRAGRLWHARRAAEDDRRKSDRVSDALIRIDCLLRSSSELATVREAAEERPNDPFVRYYLSHAILEWVSFSTSPEAAAMARRKRLREEARALLEGLRGDPAYVELASRDLAELDAKTFARDP
jgi:hypothetical protein